MISWCLYGGICLHAKYFLYLLATGIFDADIRPRISSKVCLHVLLFHYQLKFLKKAATDLASNVFSPRVSLALHGISGY